MSLFRFIGAEMTITRPGAVLLGVWTDRSAYSAAATLEGEPAAQARYAWSSAPAGAAAMQDTLARVSRLRVESEAPVYRLRLVESRHEARILAWDDAHETPDLAAARAFFEGAGHLAFALAAAYRTRAAVVLEQGHTEEGVNALRAGIDTLGDRYWNPEVLDDTGMKLVLATHSLKQGNLELAQNLLQGVLGARLALYQAAIPS